jgi:lipoprotein-anchoring transpeptidase ErfK/SrfK
MEEGWNMRRIVHLSLGVLAGLLVTSTLAQAAADISIFAYPPAPASATGGRPLAAPIPRETVSYDGPYAPGSIVISTSERRLYYVLPDHQAIKYGVGVGRPGFEWAGASRIANKREWPDWTPPAQMLKRRPDLPRHMEGGIDNPLGARAMYIAGTLYRIHGSNEPDTIGQAVSSGCIRMTNDDVTDLYERVKVGSRVVVMR